MSAQSSIHSVRVREGRRVEPGGFTLIELVAVIVVLAVLSGEAIPKYFSYREKAQESTAAGNRAALASAVNQWNLDAATRGAAAWPATLDLVLDTQQGMAFANPYRLEGQPIYLPDPDNKASKWHPQVKTVEERMASQYKGCIWYNNLNGAVRFCVAQQSSTAASVGLFNRVNGTSVKSISQTTP